MMEALQAFALDGKAVACERHGNGHINDTYLVKTDKEHLYILQRINRRVFRDVPALMDNIIAVTKHLAKKDPDPRHVLTLVPTLSGELYNCDESGEYWRLYEYVTGSVCLDRARCDADFMNSGVAFGGFQNMLSDFNADTLSETIPGFHDTPARVNALKEAIRNDAVGRAKEVCAEIDFAIARESEAGVMVQMARRGELPVRVTHNDTKLNNVMLDSVTHAPLCVIDLDTVMPGLAGNDFGDSIRFGASTALEDETDLSLVSLSLPLFRAYAHGFLGACSRRLTHEEISTLPMGAKLMTLECGVRFLTDYLMGDVYFHIQRPAHNLDRCRTQFKLVADMERKWSHMKNIIELER